MAIVLIASIVCLVVVINVAATIGIRRDDGLYAFQKKAKIILIWALPIVGAAVTYLVRRVGSLPSTHQSGSEDLLTDGALDVWTLEGNDHSSIDPGHD